MKNRPLSEDEIEKAIEKIRALYDDYIVTFTKSFQRKSEFEDRCLQARRSRIDLTRFVFAELEVVRKLKQTEEQKVAEEQEKRFKKKKEPEHAKDFADRVLDQQRKQIEKYPTCPMDPRAAYEITKLFGALDTFEKEYWPPFDSLLRRLYPSYYANPRVELEPRIYALCPGAGTVPPILSRYAALLLRLPKSMNDVEWEEKRLLKEAAFLFHKVAQVVSDLPLQDCTDDEKETVEKTRKCMHTFITDFRLKDLKPTNLGGT